MTVEPVVVGLDCSTHGAKAVAWDIGGRPVAEGRRNYPIVCPQTGWYEQDALTWVEAAKGALADVGSEVGARVCAVGLTHQRETFVGVDHKGVPVRPAIVWMDERASEQVCQIAERLGNERFHQLTGKPLSNTPSISKALWVIQHEPHHARNVHRWLDVAAMVARHLTGRDVACLGSADPTGWVDLKAGAWSLPLLALCGMEQDDMPELVAAGTAVGSISDAIAEQCGFGSDTQLVMTAGDGQVAALGSQVVDLSSAYLNLGTAIVSGTVSSTFQLDRAYRTMCGAAPGTFLLESDLKGGTFSIDWLQKVLGENVQLADLEMQARMLPPGSERLVMLPYMATVMNPYWDDNASGVLFGLRGHHGPAHIFRAILEGIALEQRLHLQEIERATGTPITQVRVVGGGASSDLWCQILADVLDRPITRVRTLEATSLGAAMMAATAAGLYADWRQACEGMGGSGATFLPGSDRSAYAELFDRVYRHIYPSIRELFFQHAQL